MAHCIHCGSENFREPNKYFPKPDETYHIDSSPVGSESEWLSSLYGFCPDCGFAEDAEEIDFAKLCDKANISSALKYSVPAEDIDLFISPEVQKRISCILSDPLCDKDKSLALAVCRYGYTPKAWLHLFRNLWMKNADDPSLKDIADVLEHFYKNTIKCARRDDINYIEFSELLILADVRRKAKMFGKASELLDCLRSVHLFGTRDAGAAILQNKLSELQKLCDGLDSRTDF